MDSKIILRTIIQTIAFGECNIISDKKKVVSSHVLDAPDFLDKHLEDLLSENGRHYKYYDCINEHYEDDDAQYVVLYARYIIDAESFNFSLFLEDAKPAEAMNETKNEPEKAVGLGQFLQGMEERIVNHKKIMGNDG